MKGCSLSTSTLGPQLQQRQIRKSIEVIRRNWACGTMELLLADDPDQHMEKDEMMVQPQDKSLKRLGLTLETRCQGCLPAALEETVAAPETDLCTWDPVAWASHQHL